MAKVLVLEDNPEMLATVLDILTDYCDHSDTQEDLELTGFPTPEEALEWARWNNFDLMITDVRMAGFADGIGTLTEIKKIRPKIYSIVITGFTDDIGVVAPTADQEIDTGAAIQAIGSAVAGQLVGKPIAGCIDIRSPGQNEVLDICR